MSGELYMLTPITSPMATRPASPDETEAASMRPPSTLGLPASPDSVVPAAALSQPMAAAVGHPTQDTAHSDAAEVRIARRTVRPATLTVPPSTSSGQDLTSASSTTAVGHQAVNGSTNRTLQSWNFLSSAVGAAIGNVRSASNSPKAQGSHQIAVSFDSSSPTGLAALLPERMEQQPHWRSSSACADCSAAAADAASCSGCGSNLCKSCASPAVTMKPGSTPPVKGGTGGSCLNCSGLCNACKPITCSFCVERVGSEGATNSRGRHSVARMCEACADTCDSCKRAACQACAASFVSCSSCGYASCEDCRLQAQVGARGSSTSGVVGGCWCAPPLRTASNVRHVSSQRYQMSQLHPSVLACSMEAVGLRDADFDEYDKFDMNYGYDRCEGDQNQQDWNSRDEAEDSWCMTSHMNVGSGVGVRGAPLTSPNGSAVQSTWLSTHIANSPASSYSSGGHAAYGCFGSYGSSAVAAAVAGGLSSVSHPGRQGRSGAPAAVRQAGLKGATPTTGMVW